MHWLPLSQSHAWQYARRMALVALASCLILVALPTAGQAAVGLPDGFVQTSVVSTGLDRPTAMAFAPDGRLFIAKQDGEIVIVKDGNLLSTAFVSLTVDGANERGLIGLTFDPDFASNGYLYVYYTATTPAVHNRISRFTAAGDLAVPGSESIVLDLENLSSAGNHNGGALHFGPDGKLYVGVGENADPNKAQSLATRFGKVLRLNTDGSGPADNPFYTTPTAPRSAVWALGLRNPYTMAVQPGTGRLFINDVGDFGPGAREEINDGAAGANYGWPCRQGQDVGNTSCVTIGAYREPIHAYSHASGDCAIAGGTFYNPVTVQFPATYVGHYFFADFCGDWIRRLDPTTGNVTDFASGLPSGLVDLRVGPDGSLYYLSRLGGLGRIRYTQTPPVPPPPPPPPTIARTWYFAEGYTGAGFDEYLTILNPNEAVTPVTITYFLPGGQTEERQLTVSGRSRATVAVHETTLGVGRDRAVAARVSSGGGGIIVERPIYFNYGEGLSDGHIVVGATSLSSTWYFAEGYTGDGFDEYLTILNPNASATPVRVTYFLADGSTRERDLTVVGQSRATIAVHDDLGRGYAVAARVASRDGAGIVVERPIYFRYTGSMGTVNGGHNALGATAPRPDWYFAEGYTGDGFDEYLTILNPSPVTADLLITYFVGGGPPREVPLSVPANTRATVAVHEVLGRGQAVAAQVSSRNGVGIVAERPIYFRYTLEGGGSIDGGHTIPGAAGPRTNWYLAEGYTGAGFDEYLTILNPNQATALVGIVYYLANGQTVTSSLTVAAQARATVAVHQTGAGVGRGQAVAAQVYTSQPGGIVVERPIYFRYRLTAEAGGADVTGGHVVLGYAP